MELFEGELLNFSHLDSAKISSPTEEEINQKYIKGDVRIITEQARYPLSGIVGMVEGDSYELNPEFQRRHRWDTRKKSRLIESFIMNVPIPPIFLYEDSYSHYQVMDGLQRLTAIYGFYKDLYILEGLEEWSELNGLYYSQLPEQVRRGIDRRYLSSVILLQETAKDLREAQRLKQLVFERINSGGIKLEEQESRNAIYNGPLNKLCIKLSRNQYLCRMWGIPEPDAKEIQTEIVSDSVLQNERYRRMEDVELVLRFLAYRQRLNHPKGSLEAYLNSYLQYGNSFPEALLNKMEDLFLRTIKLVYEVFDKNAFLLWRSRQSAGADKEQWGWFDRPSYTVYEPMMYAFSQFIDTADKIIARKDTLNEQIKKFYKENYDSFGGKNTTNISKLEDRNKLFMDFILSVIS
ncbi:MAG: DUF262 domain-containing protein [Blastocatellia bacterium]